MFHRHFDDMAIATATIGAIAAIYRFLRPFQASAKWIQEAIFPLDKSENHAIDFAIDRNTIVYLTHREIPGKEVQYVAIIYTYTGDTWFKQGEVLIPNERTGYGSNLYAAIDGDTVLIGSYVLTRTKGNWSLSSKLQPPVQEKLRIEAIALDRDTAVISTEKHTYVYRHNPDTGDWLFEAELGGVYWSGFGSNVAIDGDTIAIAGKSVKIFQRNPNTGGWIESAELKLNGHSIYYGRVAISGNTVVVGKPIDGAGGLRGSAYVFERNPITGVWSYKTKLVPHEVPIFFAFGFGGNVDIDGNTIAIGCSLPVTNVFRINPAWKKRGFYLCVRDRETGRWSLQSHAQSNSKEKPETAFGYFIRISGDRVILYKENIKCVILRKFD